MTYLYLIYSETNHIHYRAYFANESRQKKLVIEIPIGNKELFEKYIESSIEDLFPEKESYSYGYYTEDGIEFISMNIMKFPTKRVKGYRKYWCASELKDVGYVDFVPEIFLDKPDKTR